MPAFCSLKTSSVSAHDDDLAVGSRVARQAVLGAATPHCGRPVRHEDDLTQRRKRLLSVARHGAQHPRQPDQPSQAPVRPASTLNIQAAHARSYRPYGEHLLRTCVAAQLQSPGAPYSLPGTVAHMRSLVTVLQLRLALRQCLTGKMPHRMVPRWSR